MSFTCPPFLLFNPGNGSDMVSLLPLSHTEDNDTFPTRSVLVLKLSLFAVKVPSGFLRLPVDQMPPVNRQPPTTNHQPPAFYCFSFFFSLSSFSSMYPWPSHIPFSRKASWFQENCIHKIQRHHGKECVCVCVFVVARRDWLMVSKRYYYCHFSGIFSFPANFSSLS